MSRSRAIETRLEKLTPSLDEYLSTGFMEREEVVELSRQRKHWEYRLVAKPLLILDVQQAIAYELQIEEKLKQYCASSKLNFRHRWAVLERIEGLYRIGLKNLRVSAEKETIRKACVRFMKKFGRVAALSKMYGEWMMLSPTRSDLWIEAAEWTALDQRNIEDGRALIQQSLVTMATEPALWASAVKIELHMVVRLLQGLLDSHRAEVKREWEQHNEAAGLKNSSPGSIDFHFHTIANRLREENTSMANILLDLGLVKAVIEEAVESPACGPALFHTLISTASSFSVSGDIVRLLSKEGVERCFQAVQDSKQTQLVRMKWEDGAAALIWDYLSVEHYVSNRGPSSLITPVEFLERGGKVGEVSRSDRVHSSGLSLISTFAAVQAFFNDQKCSKVVSDRFFRTKGLKTVLTDGVCEVLGFLQRNGVEEERLSSIASHLLASDPLKALNITTHIADLLLIKETRKNKKTASSAGSASASASAIALAEQLVSDVSLVASSPPSQRVRYDAQTSSSSSLADFWPASRFSPFILAEDACGADVAHTILSGEKLDGETVDRLLLWWKSLDTLETERDGSTAAAASLPSREQRRQVVVKLLQKMRLIPSPMDKQRSSSSSFSPEHVDLLARRNIVSFLSGRTPITLWKVYNALEVVLGVSEDEARKPPAPSTSRSSSDEDEEEQSNTPSRSPQRVSCYSTAGLEFLASVAHGCLSEKEEWLAIEGVCALLRSRFYSLSGKTQFTREEMREVMRSKGPNFVRQLQQFLVEAARCKPRPRYALVTLLIPFNEALALETPTASNVTAARSTHEELLSLYGLTKHMDHFAPLLFDGNAKSSPSCQKDLPRELNAKDWLGYIHFERFVSKDLTRAQQVMERARRLCLAPQQLLIANHSSVTDIFNCTSGGTTASESFYESR